MSPEIATRPARKSDASEIALLVNIAVHGGLAQSWAHDARAAGTYEPLEVGRLDMMDDDSDFGWRSATMAEVDGEIAGMLLGYRKPDVFEPVPASVTGFMRPIEELEAEANGMWFVSMLGVHLNWRGKGIGSHLLDVADARRAESHASGVSLIVEDVNDSARRLYQRHGYAVRSKRPMIAWSGSKPPGQDWLLMVKD